MENFVTRLKHFASRAKEFWSNTTLNQRVLFCGALLLTVIVIIVLLTGSRTGDFVTLYTELDDRDAAAITEKLEEYRVSYQFADNGRTILVPYNEKHEARLKLASEDLPRGPVGFEIFQESSFGETQEDKRVKYQMALQGELERTIQSLNKINSARVHLVIPEPTLFSDREEFPSASVTVRVRDHNTLNKSEVKGIVNLVANSIEKLDPENVVVVDQNANILSDPLDSMESSSDMLKVQAAMKRQVEREKQQAIQSMLDKTLGPDNAVVRVNAELNFDQREQLDERYFHDPDGRFIRSEELIEESGEQTTPAQQGIPGVDENVPEYLEEEGENGYSSYESSHTTRNYEINRTETITTYSVGDIKYDYLTVAVLVNNEVADQAFLGADNQERADSIRGIVATAAGLRENRENENVLLDDNIAVTFMDFYTEPEEDIVEATFMEELLRSPYTPWFILGLIITILIMVWLLARRRKVDDESLTETNQFETVVEEEINIDDIIDKNLTPEEKERQKVKQEVDKIIDQDPDNAAQVIKTWLSED
ncbi:Flagellar M-ring protein FliF [Candidatus Syntrophocurvum alkaliphilum]|uniref:Flagellar M-ring protein n=1 Tax=Candidatus Syntrophocurvum alkaliphilum TaxID=2293317 RepID=A0A6I6D855_9FIRM|nr:flagellar basal-body MS-ring/collar protein FliF [Candidatus Syntrophocurvum alkaliphilum]QGT99163.1 Flagellar M-ring protein FliF [Candidatus Syntrophocurvum alkaliphilum]